MELHHFKDDIWYFDYQQETDRPILGYIKGEKYAIAVDAGHSDNHVRDFYQALQKENLPLPTITIITHWHWDHSFGMHAINGLSLASKKTNDILAEVIKKQTPENEEKFRNLDPTIALEYQNNKKFIITLADIVYQNSIILDLGNQIVKVFESPSPHCDDATLIYLPKSKVLFIGDATSGVFPSWTSEPEKAKKMLDFIKDFDFEYCIGGHWPIETKEETINTLLEHINIKN